MTNEQMPRFSGAASMHLPAPPLEVFPLLCPVREYDWIPVWDCELLYARTGAAEADCVFRTAFPDRGEEVWTCTRYEPPRAVEYVRFGERGVVIHLSIALAEDADGATRMLWNTVYTAADASAAAHVAAMSAAQYEQEARAIEHMLAHYLEHGTAAMPEHAPPRPEDAAR